MTSFQWFLPKLHTENYEITGLNIWQCISTMCFHTLCKLLAQPTIQEMDPFFNKMKIDSCVPRNSNKVYIVVAICLTLLTTMMSCHRNRNGNDCDCEPMSALFHTSSIIREQFFSCSIFIYVYVCFVFFLFFQ